MQPVTGLNALDVSNETEPDTKRFVVSFNDQGTNTCLLVHYGKPNGTYIAYGDLLTCNEVFTDHHFEYLGNLTTPLELFEIYENPGDYIVTFKAKNQLPGSQYVEVPVTVIEIDCLPPIIEIKNRVDDYLNGTEFWRSKAVQLYVKTTVDCNASSVVTTRVWHGFLIDPYTGEVAEYVDLSPLDSYRKTFLYIPPFFLKKGYYKFRFSINMTSLKPHPLLPYHESDETHVIIVPSPIVGQMSDGAQSRIIRGWGQRVYLGPGNFSIDPDDAENKNFKITWFCRRLPNEKISRTIADEDQPISEPIYNRENYDESNDKGGCFGMGPGRIKVLGGEIDWNTTVFQMPGVTYELIVRIDPPDREPSWSGIQLVLLERKPPSIQVRCQTEALCYPHVPIGQKINPVRVGLIGDCSENCDGELKYQWTVFGVNKKGNEIMLPDASQYVVGATEQKMALGKEFFDEYYPKFGDFFAKLAVTNEEGTRGESDIFLHINQPPEGGECVLLEFDGPLALLDKYSVQCSNFIDPEGKPIEYYAFWIRNLKTGVTSYLTYGPDKEATLILPYGNFTLGADIKDKEGSLAKLNITDVITFPPSKEQYDAFMSSKQFENADAAGDQGKMNMVSQAVSSLMNVRLVSETEILEDEDSFTTESTTTESMLKRNGTKSREKTEKEIEEDANTRTKMVKSVDNIMNIDTLDSLEQVGSVLTAISGRGKGVDNDAKEVIIKLLNKTVSLASTLKLESPQQLLDFCMYAVGTMGGIVNVSSMIINNYSNDLKR